MVNELDPLIGNWYRHLDKGQMFRVVAFDEHDALVELQHFDGDIEEVDLTAWRSMDLEIAEAPEDWTGSQILPSALSPTCWWTSMSRRSIVMSENSASSRPRYCACLEAVTGSAGIARSL
jgi:hypothetical protein